MTSIVTLDEHMAAEEIMAANQSSVATRSASSGFTNKTDGPFRVLKIEWWMGGVPVLYIQDLATGQFGDSAGYFAWRSSGKAWPRADHGSAWAGPTAPTPGRWRARWVCDRRGLWHYDKPDGCKACGVLATFQFFHSAKAAPRWARC